MIASFVALLPPFPEGPAIAMADPAPDDLGLSALIDGVQQLSSPGTPGPVYADSAAWFPIVGGDEDASFPSTYVMARQFGLGHVMIAGHEGILTRPDILDNGRFLLNSIRWLDFTASRRVQYTVGHAEWAGVNTGVSALRGLLQAQGYSLDPLTGAIDAGKLNSSSVLIIGNAWGAFTESEISAVETFVENGGGVFLFGLGWSWPGALDDYPMMRMAKPYGVRWLTSTIVDPTNFFQGSPVFRTFYPDIQNGTIFDAMTLIQQAHTQHPTDLSQVLETDGLLRTNFVRAHRLLAVVTAEFAADDIQRQIIFDFYTGLIPSLSSYYGRSHVFPRTAAPTSAWVRERAWLNWRDAVDLTAEVKNTIAQQLQGRRQTLFEQFGIIFLDNSLLNDRQLEFIQNFFTRLPTVQSAQSPAFHNMGSISAADFLGLVRFSTDGFFRGRSGSVNIFSLPIGGSQENSFPPDVSPGLIDVFSVVVAHEVNHVIDAYYVSGNLALAARKSDLIRRAGTDDLNYLRSMVGGRFFQENPQEFIASIANEWLTDSEKTLQLGLVRFLSGRAEPLNQALFFAELYSVGGNTTRFYRTDTTGHIDSVDQGLRRNKLGQIDQLSFGGQTYRLARDTSGNVLDVQVDIPQLVNDRFLPLSPSDVTTRFVTTPCASGASAGTYTITATFRNVSQDVLSGLFFSVNTLDGGNLLCNADTGPGGQVLTVPQQPSLADGVLAPGESVVVTFQIGMFSLSRFTFLVDLHAFVQ